MRDTRPEPNPSLRLRPQKGHDGPTPGRPRPPCPSHWPWGEGVAGPRVPVAAGDPPEPDASAPAFPAGGASAACRSASGTSSPLSKSNCSPSSSSSADSRFAALSTGRKDTVKPRGREKRCQRQRTSGRPGQQGEDGGEGKSGHGAPTTDVQPPRGTDVAPAPRVPRPPGSAHAATCKVRHTRRQGTSCSLHMSGRPPALWPHVPGRGCAGQGVGLSLKDVTEGVSGGHWDRHLRLAISGLIHRDEAWTPMLGSQSGGQVDRCPGSP